MGIDLSKELSNERVKNVFMNIEKSLVDEKVRHCLSCFCLYIYYIFAVDLNSIIRFYRTVYQRDFHAETTN